MKKLLLITLSLILFNCSNDDETTNNPPASEYSEIFAYKGDDNPSGTNYEPRIVKINPTNGNETDIAYLNLGEYLYGFVYNNSTNEIYGLENNKLYKINVNNGTHTTINLDNSTGEIFYEELIIDNNNNIYAYKGDDTPETSYVPRIVKINPNNGTETDIAFLNIGEYLYGFVFNNATNQIYALENNKLYKINISDGSHTTVDLDNSTGEIFYEELIIDNSNNIYAYKGDDTIGTSYIPRIVRIDPSNGNETDIANLNIGEYLYGFVYDNETDEILGLEDNKLYKINVSNGTHSTINLDNSSSDIFYEELIIK